MTEEKKVDFEALLKELNEIVNKVENDTLPLDESIKLYQRGKEIINELEGSLKEAEEKIAELSK